MAWMVAIMVMATLATKITSPSRCTATTVVLILRTIKETSNKAWMVEVSVPHQINSPDQSGQPELNAAPHQQAEWETPKARITADSSSRVHMVKSLELPLNSQSLSRHQSNQLPHSSKLSLFQRRSISSMAKTCSTLMALPTRWMVTCQTSQSRCTQKMCPWQTHQFRCTKKMWPWRTHQFRCTKTTSTLKTSRLWMTITTTTFHQAAQSQTVLLWTAHSTKTATVVARSNKNVTIVKCLPLPLTFQGASLPNKTEKSSVTVSSVSLATPRRLILTALLQVVPFT